VNNSQVVVEKTSIIYEECSVWLCAEEATVLLVLGISYEIKKEFMAMA
jgi:hypothetical protein